MQVLGFRKEWFDPASALVQGPLIGGGLMVPLHPFQVISVKRTVNLPTPVTGSTLCFAGAGIAGGGICTAFHFLRFILYPRRQKGLSLRAKIAIVLGIVGELGGSVEGRHVLPVG